MQHFSHQTEDKHGIIDHLFIDYTLLGPDVRDTEEGRGPKL